MKSFNQFIEDGLSENIDAIDVRTHADGYHSVAIHRAGHPSKIVKFETDDSHEKAFKHAKALHKASHGEAPINDLTDVTIH